MHAERLDAMVTFAGCDKSLPGMMMAAARLNLPGGVPVRRVDPARPAQRQGARRRSACSRPSAPTRWEPSTTRSCTRSRPTPVPPRAPAPACSPPTPWRRSARPSGCRCPAPRRRPPSTVAATTTRYASGTAVLNLLRQNIRPRDILTKAAFENAIAVTMALGGSTNAVLHLLAIAYEAQVELELEDFNKVAARVPHLADTKPHGKYHMLDVDRVGGVPVVMAMLLEAGLIHGDEITVTGRTVAENLAMIAPPPPDGEVIHTLSRPHPPARRHRRAARLARPQRGGPEGRRHRLRPLRGPGPGLRRRVVGHGGGARRPDQRRRHRRHPLRGPQGRSGHAGDAGHHRVP